MGALLAYAAMSIFSFTDMPRDTLAVLLLAVDHASAQFPDDSMQLSQDSDVGKTALEELATATDVTLGPPEDIVQCGLPPYDQCRALGNVRVLLTLEIRELGAASGIVRVTIHRFPTIQGTTQEVVDDLYVEHDGKSWRVARVENVTRS